MGDIIFHILFDNLPRRKTLWYSGIYHFVIALLGILLTFVPTLKRFFVFHFILPFILCGFVILHLFYLHLHSSNNPLRINTNNKVPFFPFILVKDFLDYLSF